MKRIILISLLSLPLMTFAWTQDCCEAEEIATNNCGGLGCYIPQCTESCDWEPMQCWSSTGYCWCVDEEGVEIEGSSMPSWQGYPDCYDFLDIGDVNEDGILNVLDLILVIDMILNNEYSLIADVNEDEIVNILDIIQLVDTILS